MEQLCRDEFQVRSGREGLRAVKDSQVFIEGSLHRGDGCRQSRTAGTFRKVVNWVSYTHTRTQAHTHIHNTRTHAHGHTQAQSHHCLGMFPATSEQNILIGLTLRSVSFSIGKHNVNTTGIVVYKKNRV